MYMRGITFALSLQAAMALMLAQAPVSLTGSWVLNREASEVGGLGGDPDRGGPVGGRSPIGGGFGMPGRQPLGGMGGPGGAGMGAPRTVDPQVRKQQMALIEELVAPAHRMTIAQEGSQVTFTFQDGRSMRYRTDGRAEKHQMLNGVVETETRWKKDKLVRETNLDDGMTIVETFSTQPARQLVLEVSMRGGPGRRKPLRRVYDPLEPPEDPAPLE